MLAVGNVGKECADPREVRLSETGARLKHPGLGASPQLAYIPTPFRTTPTSALRYIVMLEPDHILLRPLPNFMQGEKPAAYGFAYMVPTEEGNRQRIKR